MQKLDNIDDKEKETLEDFLRQKESNMRQIVGKAYTELGKELYEAQQELAKHGYGCFEEWFTSLGFKKRNVYRLIDRYSLVSANLAQSDMLEDLPVSLTYEISGKSSESTPAKAQAKSEVLAGDIATLKEYRERIKELERKAERERLNQNRLYVHLKVHDARREPRHINVCMVPSLKDIYE